MSIKFCMDVIVGNECTILLLALINMAMIDLWFYEMWLVVCKNVSFSHLNMVKEYE